MRYLFITDEHITHLRHLKRTVHQPTPHAENPVIEPTQPWEAKSVSNYGTVMYDSAQQIFKFWYLAGSGPCVIKGKSLPGRTLLCYATSIDGIHWDKPNLGQVEFEGSKDNNILKIGRVNIEGAAIIDEPDDPDQQRRYKAFFWDHGAGEVRTLDDGQVIWAEGNGDGMWVAFSPDGIHWTNHPGNPVLDCYSDTSHSVVKDPRTNQYAIYGRFGFGRTLARAQSSDFINWSIPRSVLEPDEHEAEGPYPITQFYGMSVDLYEGMYLGGLWVYRQGTDGTMDTQLAASHDGIHWQRVADRQVFLPLAETGNRGDGMVRLSPRYILKDDLIYLYHGLVSGPHQGPNFSKETIVRKFPSSIGLATLRRDGFVSLDATDQQGTLITRAIWMEGKTLHLNIDIADGGQAVVAVHNLDALDIQAPAEALEVAGFECSQPLVTGSTDVAVQFPKGDWSQLKNKICRLQIQLTKAHLYSFWFESNR